MLLRIELGGVGRQGGKCYITRNDKIAAAMIAGSIHDEQDLMPPKFPSQHIEEDLKAFCIRRQMEIKAGLPSKRGGNTPRRARNYNIKSLRDTERSFVAQAEAAYVRFIAACSERPKKKPSDTRCATAAQEESRLARRKFTPSSHALGHAVGQRPKDSALRR